MRQELTSQAEDILGHGISITLTDDRKASVGPWKEFQSRLMTEQELHERIVNSKGIAIICGKISGNLEVIDVDLKYDISGTLFKELEKKLGVVYDKLTIAKTVSGGYHLYYRCPVIEGNQKLARRHTTVQEQAQNPLQKVLVLIETRGEAGYVVAPPTEGYQWVQGDYKSLPIISVEERDYILETCRSFNSYLEEVIHHEPTPTFGISPIDDYNEQGDVIQLLQKHGWKKLHTHNGKTFFRRPGKDDGTSGDYLHDKKWFSVFTTSTQFEPNKAYNPAAVFCKLEANNNWTECVKLLAKAGYGKDSRLYKADQNHLKLIKKLINQGMSDDLIVQMICDERGLPENEARKLVKEADRLIAKGDDFWEEDAKGRVHIIKDRIIKFLESRGFRLMPVDNYGNNLILVQIQDNIVEESTIEKAKKELYQYAQTRNQRAAEWLIEKNNLINESFLEFIKKEDLSILKDTPTEAYYPFLNCIVKITDKEIKTINYSEINSLIWRSAVIKKEIVLENFKDPKWSFQNPSDTPAARKRKIQENPSIINDLNPATDFYAQFIMLICDKDPARFESAISAIGYLLHGYKNPSIPYAVCLAEEVDDDSKGGGTGKGIFVQGINQLIKVEQFDGKNFRHDKGFQWQRITEDTRIMAIQDLRKGVDFEGFYTIITDTMTVERKHKKEIDLPFEKSPKIVFTTNYMIPDLANHAKRRLWIFPFSNYFSPEHTPLDEFGLMLFTGWDAPHWNNFYNFMFYCVHFYLNHGVIMMEKTNNMKIKAVSNLYSEEFKSWFLHFIESNSDWMGKREMYELFLENSDFTTKDFSQKKFTMAIKNTCNIFGVDFEERNAGINGGRQFRIVNNTSVTTHIPEKTS